MDIGTPKPNNTIQETAEELGRLRSFKPFKYSGRWFVGVTPDSQGWAYRTRTAAINHSYKTRSGGYAEYKIGG